jgi:hypothetical protein
MTTEVAAQSRAGQTNVVAHDMDGSGQRDCGFLGGHPAEVVHFEQFRERRVLALQSLERAVQVQ